MYIVPLNVNPMKPSDCVRVEPGRLRTRLNNYYENGGKNDPALIELPKGTYVPVFRPAEAPIAAPIPGPTVEPHVERLKAPGKRR